LPLLVTSQHINVSQYKGQEDLLFDKYMDTDLTDKANADSKTVRNLLGLGVIEATGLKKATSCNTLHSLVSWYVSAQVGSF
jgi:hypothetical protein